jgi:hypothetical protein
MKRTAGQDFGKRNAERQYLSTDTKNLLFEEATHNKNRYDTCQRVKYAFTSV